MENEVNKKIEGTWVKLMEDASNEANFFFSEAVEKIDSKFGKGYAKGNPKLIEAYMNAAAIINQGTVIGKCIQDGLEPIAEHLDGINATLGE